jgi:GNAT superfamily N-acetyltransferase
MIEYRKAITDDIETLAKLRIKMLCAETDHSEEFRIKLHENTIDFIKSGFREKNFITWVAVCRGEIIAMSGANFFTLPPNDWCPNGKTAYIGNVYTLPDFRKQGIASKLISLVVEEAKQYGCERILLHTTDMGRPLYESLGFEISPTTMAFYPYR